MIRDVIAYVTSSVWHTVSLIVIVLAFVAIVIWTYRGRRDRFAYQSRLPLDESPDSVSSDSPRIPERKGAH